VENADRKRPAHETDMVRTGSGGSAEIRLADGTLFHLRAESLMTCDESTENPASRVRQGGVTIQSERPTSRLRRAAQFRGAHHDLHPDRNRTAGATRPASSR